MIKPILKSSNINAGGNEREKPIRDLQVDREVGILIFLVHEERQILKRNKTTSQRLRPIIFQLNSKKIPNGKPIVFCKNVSEHNKTEGQEIGKPILVYPKSDATVSMNGSLSPKREIL